MRLERSGEEEGMGKGKAGVERVGEEWIVKKWWR